MTARRPLLRAGLGRLGRRALVVIGAMFVLNVIGLGVAFAFWSSTDNSNPARAAADSVAAGHQPSGSATGSDITIGWSASTTVAGHAVTGYTIARYSVASGGTATAAGGGCAGTVASLTCTEQSVGGGSWYYAVTPKLQGWTGAESARSAAIVVSVGDTTPPTVSSITRVGTSPTNASSVQWTVTFSEAVTGVGTADFALTATGTASASISSVTGSGTTYTVTANTVAGDGTLRLDVTDDDSIVDTSANKLGGTGAGNGNFTTGQAYTIDHTAPTVTVNQAAGQLDPTNASPVNFTAVFSEAVTGFDGTDVTIGGTSAGTKTATVTGGPTTYNVAISGMTGTGTVTASVGANKAQDAAGNGNAASTTGDDTVTYDVTAPTVSSIARVGTSPTNASSLQWTVTFSESVTGVGTADFALTATGTASASVSSVTGSGTTYTVTANTVAGDGTLRLDVTDDDSIADTATNKLGGTGTGNGNSTTGQAFTVDRTAPTVTSINRAAATPTNAGSVSWTVGFSEPVTGVDTADFALATSGVTSASISTVTGSNATYTVTVNTGSGSGTIGLNLVDDDSIIDALTNKLAGTGVGNGNFTGEVYTIDKVLPTVTINQAAGQADPTNASPVNFTAVFSEAVTGFDGSDVTIAGTATGTRAATVTGGPTTYNVAIGITGTPGSGTVIASIAASRAQDGATNGNAASTSGDNTVTYDITAPATPSVPDLTAPSDSGSSSTDNITNITTPSFTGTAEANSTVQLFAGGTLVGSGSTNGSGAYSATVTSALANGTNVMTVKATDAAGNQSVASTSLSITVDTVAPTVTAIDLTNANGVAEKDDTVGITFSERLNVSTLCSAWTTGDAASQSITSNSAVTVTITNNAANDTLTTASTTCTTSRFGSVGLNGDYVGSAGTGTLVFNGTGNGKSVVNWDATNFKLLVTLGDRTGTALPAVAGAVVTYVPSTGVQDTAGNALSTTGVPSGTAQRL
jgi:hypothetical protein